MHTEIDPVQLQHCDHLPVLCHVVPSKQTLNYTVRTVPGDIPVFLSAVQSFTCSVPNLEIEGLAAMNTHTTFKKADSYLPSENGSSQKTRILSF